MNNYQQVLIKLEERIAAIEANTTDVYREIEVGIRSCKTAIQTLRLQVQSVGFATAEEECHFFKTIKPTIVGYLLGYLQLAKVERAWPVANKKQVLHYIYQQINQSQAYFQEHIEAYEYLLRDRTDRDHEYFMRNTPHGIFHPHTINMYIDEDFATPADGVVAMIKAHQWLIERMTRKIKTLQAHITNPCMQDNTHLKWTASKVDLVELIYALHAAEVCNNGQATIKQIAISVQHVFNITISDYYRTYLEIQARKGSRTKLLDTFKEALIQRIEETERL